MSGNGPVFGPDEDSAVAELRRQLRRADEAIEVPPGLWERVSVPRTEPQSLPKPRHRRWWAVPIATAVLLALAATSYAAGVLWQRHTSTPSTPPLDRATASAGTVSVEILTPVPYGVLFSGIADVSACSPPDGSPDYLKAGIDTSCEMVERHGIGIVDIQVDVVVHQASRTIQVCLNGPDSTLACSGDKFVRVGQVLELHWSPNSAEQPAGKYCVSNTPLGATRAHVENGEPCVDL